MTVPGWGSTSFGGPAAIKLRKVDLQVIGDKRCVNLASSNGADYRSYIFKLCTEAVTVDTCQGI